MGLRTAGFPRSELRRYAFSLLFYCCDKALWPRHLRKQSLQWEDIRAKPKPGAWNSRDLTSWSQRRREAERDWKSQPAFETSKPRLLKPLSPPTWNTSSNKATPPILSKLFLSLGTKYWNTGAHRGHSHSKSPLYFSIVFHIFHSLYKLAVTKRFYTCRVLCEFFFFYQTWLHFIVFSEN